MSEEIQMEKDLLKEKSLFDVFLLSMKLPNTRFNVCVMIFFAIVAAGVSFFNFWKIEEMLVVTRDIVSSGFDIALNLLGFLLAGFTVFTSVYKSELMVHMSAKIESRSGLSFLKYNMLHFMKFFIILLIFSFFCFILKIMAGPAGFFPGILKAIGIEQAKKYLLIKLYFVIVVCFQFYVLLSLKSLVFNIYHIIMTSIAWDIVTSTNLIEGPNQPCEKNDKTEKSDQA